MELQNQAKMHNEEGVGLVYEELVSQPYQNCKFSAGFVEGHPIDTLYMRFEREGEPGPLTMLLRPDEVAAIAHCLTGVLFSHCVAPVVAAQVAP